MLEDDIECELCTVISIDSLLGDDKIYYLRVYLNNCAYKIKNKQMTDYLDEMFLKIGYYKCCITIEFL